MLNWLELINKLRGELDYIEGVLASSNYDDEVRLIVARGFIMNLRRGYIAMISS